MRRVAHAFLVVVTVAGGLVTVGRIAFASLFGEENATLVQILAELYDTNDQLGDLSESAAEAAATARDLLAAYEDVHSGLEELRAYSAEKFVADFSADLYTQYPGLGEFAGATENLRRFDRGVRTSSPFTAYEAISAVAGELSDALRDDVDHGRARIDREILLRAEAAASYSTSHLAEEEARALDDELRVLEERYRASLPSPGSAALLTAETQLLIARQQSEIIRLLARLVHQDAVDKTIEYGARVSARNRVYEIVDETAGLVDVALEPPRMIRFEPIW